MIRESIEGRQQILFRIIATKDDLEVDRFNINFSELSMTEAIIENEQVQELYQEGSTGSFIIRLPSHRSDGGRLVYIYNRGNGLDT